MGATQRKGDDGMRFSWIRAHGVVAVSAAVMALQGVPTLAQFVPYTGGPTQGYNQYQAHTAQQVPPQYRAQPQYAQPQYTQPQQRQPQYTQPQYTQPQQRQPQYGQPQYGQPQYTAMAFQGSGTREGVPTLSQSIESVAPGQNVPMQNDSAAPAPMAYESYSPSGCATGACGGYNTFEGGGCGIGGACGGCDTGCSSCGGCRRWFGGFYGLYMERDGNPWKALAFSTSTGNAPPYYPADNEIAMNLTDIDNDTFTGAEVRFGSTLGPCGNYGWEFAYWGLVEETSTAVVTDTAADANRLYTMIPHTGMFYNGRSVNDYYEYGPPTSNPAGDTIRLRQVTARNSFSMQNLELNLLRFPVCGGGYYSGPARGAYGGGRARGLGRRGGLGSTCGAGGCDTGCDSCAGGSCGTGCCGGGSRFSATGLVGVRYIRIDEDFMFRGDFDNETQATTGFISHDVDVDSHLVGAQFGCNMLYRMGCAGRWALHCNSVFGIYGNHMEVWNRMDAPVAGGDVTNNDGSTFDYRYEDDDIAFLGEVRAGASYQYSCNWRLYGGYRLIGMGGMALAYDQISDQNISAAQTSYVDSDGSIFIHGLQGGVEFTY